MKKKQKAKLSRIKKRKLYLKIMIGNSNFSPRPQSNHLISKPIHRNPMNKKIKKAGSDTFNFKLKATETNMEEEGTCCG